MSLHGLLLVDKPVDWTSHDVVAKLRRLFHLSAVGHSGTLDPFASGLMVMLLGHGTKLSDYILSQDKTYEVLVRLGIETDSLDKTGRILRESQVDITETRLQTALSRCQGEVELEVPVFSAIKVKGKKLYDYARSGKEVEVPLKKMKFYDLQLLEFDGRDRLRVRLSCSKGSYIRSWAAWLGKTLGCGAVAEELRRTTSRPFEIEKAVSLGQLEAWAEQGGTNWSERLGCSYIPLVEALPNVRRIRVSSRDEKLFMNGQISHDISARLIADVREAQEKGENLPVQVVSVESRRLLGILEVIPDKGLKIRRVFRSLS